MSISKIEVLEDIYVGNVDSSIEAQEPEFFNSVFIHTSSIHHFIQEDKLFLAGSKGSGKTRISFFLQKNRSQPESVRKKGKRVYYTFVNLQKLGGEHIAFTNTTFSDIATDIIAKYQDALKSGDKSSKEYIKANYANFIKISYRQVGALTINNIWLHVICQSALKGVAQIFKERNLDSKRYPLMNDYMDAYGARRSDKLDQKIRDRIDKLKTSLIKYELKINNHQLKAIGGCIRPKQVLEEIGKFLEEQKAVIYIIIDNPEFIITNVDFEELEMVRNCLIGDLFLLAASWHADPNDPTANIFPKILTRADLPMRVKLDNRDKISDRYVKISFDDLSLLKMILKRLLFSRKLRKIIDFLDDIENISNYPLNICIEYFEMLFGKSTYSMPYCSLPYAKRSEISEGAELPLHKFLYYFLLDGRGVITVRFLIQFLNFCRQYELEKCEEFSYKNWNISETTPLFSEDIIKQVLYEKLPPFFSTALDGEYPFIEKELHLLRSLCRKDFRIEELREVLNGSGKTNEIIGDTISGLFYSGIIGGDDIHLERSNNFYIPAFVQLALEKGLNKSLNGLGG